MPTKSVKYICKCEFAELWPYIPENGKCTLEEFEKIKTKIQIAADKFENDLLEAFGKEKPPLNEIVKESFACEDDHLQNVDTRHYYFMFRMLGALLVVREINRFVMPFEEKCGSVSVEEKYIRIRLRILRYIVGDIKTMFHQFCRAKKVPLSEARSTWTRKHNGFYKLHNMVHLGALPIIDDPFILLFIARDNIELLMRANNQTIGIKNLSKLIDKERNEKESVWNINDLDAMEAINKCANSFIHAGERRYYFLPFLASMYMEKIS
ncbi:hypothetical protein [Maridesulfovibrio sp.]|uniref:hypothetical protein n=1 Tax=Maridesulfovibrio sp. TaxID=2795000 RepID=UPI002A18C1A3|nr:hypothetical protein [Maridesulfovibrio sp.]